jgi:ubiquinone/menaquinone biosynthesis C-methylase UbiE
VTTARRTPGSHGNPADVKRMIRRQLDPRRAAWQKPEAVVRTLRLRRGDVVAEVGAGPGFWTERLARAVGPAGHVYAVDPEPVLLEVLRRRLDGVRNVTPVLNRDDDPMLPPGRCDLALIVNAYHHFADAPAFLRRVARCLKPGGRLANIDWADRDTPQGPPAGRRVPPAEFLHAARRAGLILVAEHDFLPQQYFFVLRRRRARR